MASPETKPNVCLMCLDAPAVKKLGTCEHSYCMPCLQAHMEEQMKSEHKVISACPACQQSKLENPKGGANVDNAGEGKVTVPSISQTPTTSEKKTTPFVQGNCKLCHYKGITQEAVNICEEYKSILLCGKCSHAHRQKKATQHHVVTTLAGQTRDEVLCKSHEDEALKFFCYTCSTNICHVCISLDHEDHVVETFNNVVHDEVQNIESALENEKEWLNTLQSDEKELQQSKATAQEMEDVLIKSIEDHAEKCIEEILKNKKALQKQVRADFEAIHGLLTKHLEAMPELQRASADITAAANRLLNEQAELHSTYVENLVGMKQQLANLKEGHPSYGEDRERYRKAYKDVCRKAMKFYPRTPNCKIGGFKDPGPRCNAGGLCVCETCERKADPARVVECRQKGLCTCGTCAKVSKWPSVNRVRECRQKGSCTCGTCAMVSKWPDKNRVDECHQKWACTCGTCTKETKWPNEARVDECKQKKTCTCGTCGFVYNWKMLSCDGYCCYCGKTKIRL